MITEEDMITGDVCIWHDIKFNRKPVQHGEKQRFESSSTSRFHVILWEWESSQWGAMFIPGLCSVTQDPDDALKKAARMAIDSFRNKAYELEDALFWR